MNSTLNLKYLASKSKDKFKFCPHKTIWKWRNPLSNQYPPFWRLCCWHSLQIPPLRPIARLPPWGPRGLSAGPWSIHSVSAVVSGASLPWVRYLAGLHTEISANQKPSYIPHLSHEASLSCPVVNKDCLHPGKIKRLRVMYFFNTLLICH